MPTTVPDEERLYVVVGIVGDPAGRMLIQQRRPGTPRAGQWEFPGGKLEPEETPEQALTRELEEELGIRVTGSKRLVKLRYDYDHAQVLLDTFLVTGFTGSVSGLEGQAIEWATIGEIPGYDVLEAVFPILDVVKSHAAAT